VGPSTGERERLSDSNPPARPSGSMRLGRGENTAPDLAGEGERVIAVRPKRTKSTAAWWVVLGLLGGGGFLLSGPVSRGAMNWAREVEGAHAAAPVANAPPAPEAQPSAAAPEPAQPGASAEAIAAIAAELGEVIAAAPDLREIVNSAAPAPVPEDVMPSGPLLDAGELSEAALEAADEALNDTEEREVKLVPPSEPSEERIDSLAQVKSLIKRGKLDAAIRGIQQLRRKTPRAANLPYMLGNLYFDKHWWSDGLAKYREAIKMAPSYRANGRIHRDAIRALGEDKTYARARALLVRDNGRAAGPALRRAAHGDSSKEVRKRAASILRQLNR
jgi:tetratricopeptide (TPR) repeat protein